MFLNRRKMLQASIGAIALSLTGCKSTKTVVILINASNASSNPGPAAPISVNITGPNNLTFRKTNLQPGHQYSQTYHTNDASGTVVNFNTVSVSVGGVDAGFTGGSVTAGQTNTFTFDGIDVISSSNATVF